MKTIINLLILVMIIFFGMTKAYAFTNVERQEIAILNFLGNGGVENGIAGFTATSGTTVSLESGIKRSGLRSAKVVALANGKMATPSIILPAGDNNETVFYYQSTSSSFKVSITNSSSTVISGPYTMPACTSFCAMHLSSFSFTAGAIYYIVVENTGLTSETIYLDDFAVSIPAVGDGGILKVHGSTSSPIILSASNQVPFASQARQIIFVKSNGGPVILTSNPSIQSGTTVGQEMILRGASDTDYVRINNGNGTDLNGTITLTTNGTLYLVWDGTVWAEISRR